MAQTVRTYRHSPNVGTDPNGTLVDTESTADGSFSVSVDTTGWTAGNYDITSTVESSGKSESLKSNALALTVQAAGSAPTIGLGTTTADLANNLTRTTGLPTFNNMTVMGWYYYTGTGGPFMVFDITGAAESTAFYTYIDGGRFYWANNNQATVDLLGISAGWYFWCLTSGPNPWPVEFWCVPAGTAVASPGNQSNWGWNTTVGSIRLLVSHVPDGPGTGFHARVRAWNSILTPAEINAERLSATPVKAGSVFNAGLQSTSDLGGFTLNGTLVVGP
jgi:hypothetical protein